MKSATVILALLPALTSAQVPQKLGYQGRLLNDQGSAINGPVNIVFSIYDKEDAATPIWSEVQQQVKVVNGFYGVFIGDGTTGGVTGSGIPADVLKNGGDRWLGVAIGNSTEMTPRQRIASVAYAVTAQNVSGGMVNASSLAIRADGQDQLTIKPNGDLHLGAENNPNASTGWGSAIYFRGAKAACNGGDGVNTDPLFISRYNVSCDRSELRAAIGDNGNADMADKFVIGVKYGEWGVMTGEWVPLFSVDSLGATKARGTIQASQTPDIAETIPAEAAVEAGDVVCADRRQREHVIRCRREDPAMLGVISNGSSSFLINSNASSLDAPRTGKPLVLAGRVPVKVSLENGVVHNGDLLALSSKPGMAMRATAPGPTIGVALESFDGRKGQTGTVLAMIMIEHGLGLAQLAAENERLLKRFSSLERSLEAALAQCPTNSPQGLATR